MASFFSDLGKRITDAGQGVAQQTKNLTDVARLNGTITENQRTITQIYTKLGQAYYEGHKDGPDPDCKEFVDQINALNDEIARCQEEVKRIKGMGKCPNCGADVPPQSQFCQSCGAKIETAPPAAAGRTCPNCGASVPEGNAFCTKCGTKMGNP